QQVRFLPPRAGNDGKTAQVSAAVLNPGSYPARLDFRLYRSGNQWRVYDVAANGQSAIVHYRQQLMRQMQQRRMAQMRHMAPPMQRGMPPGAYGPVPMR
ncbi:MAG: ABC transporter substrate-binding protein, partial [Gammaproteobacteria bacterium]|nr:ABC transporter substrate-binding protein [Gammaproteobacteria bacterium]